MSAISEAVEQHRSSRRRVTTEELLAMPDDGVERWIIRGELWERPMTRRNRFHSRVLVRIGHLLSEWVDAQPEPRGEVLGGEVGCRLTRDPELTVGIDLVYISPELAAAEPKDTKLIDGVPTLVVEILSPNDTTEEITEKVKGYLGAGVPAIWIVHPIFQTVMVHQPGKEPELFNIRDEITCEPHLPGLRLPVDKFFKR
jgi:Uma2 family endonuclease